MATITFDTLKFVEKLKSGGIPKDQTKAISKVFRDASANINLLKRMLGILLGGVMTLILKAFFPL